MCITENRIEDLVSTLESVNYKISGLKRDKLSLEAEIADLIYHPEMSGDKTYIKGRYKITLSSKPKFIIDKEGYESVGSRIPVEFNPIKVSLSYGIDKKILAAAEKYACDETLRMIHDLITIDVSRTTIKKVSAAI